MVLLVRIGNSHTTLENKTKISPNDAKYKGKSKHAKTSRTSPQYVLQVSTSLASF